MQDNTQKIARKIAYLHNGEVVFGIGYDLGYVDPNYDRQDCREFYVSGSKHKFTYTTIDGEVKNILLSTVTNGINWLEGARSVFDKNVDEVVAAYKAREIHISYIHLKKESDNSVVIDLNGGGYKNTNRIFCGVIDANNRLKLDGSSGEENLQKEVRMLIDNTNSIITLSSTLPSPFWYEGFVDIKQNPILPHVSIELFIKGGALYYREVGENKASYKFSDVTRSDCLYYRKGVEDTLIATGLGK